MHEVVKKKVEVIDTTKQRRKKHWNQAWNRQMKSFSKLKLQLNHTDDHSKSKWFFFKKSQLKSKAHQTELKKNESQLYAT